MILIVCATELELQSLLDIVPADESRWVSLVCGVGVVETVLALGRMLEQQKSAFDAVLHFGVGGAYIPKSGNGAKLLDICLAKEELFGDFGICHREYVESLPEHLVHKPRYPLDVDLYIQCVQAFEKRKITFKQGTFVTVAGVSGTAKRGEMLHSQYNALCENMEGAAVARVCEAFSVPMLELRCISNYVEDRDLSRWKLQEACQKAAVSVSVFLQELLRK
jgi:futalosine hydrolase